ncbi:MAG TPA: glycosyltransferase [Novosphingobium sp.]|nr:glycosyltransferase [Novosphingobium sp.]
MRIVDVCGFYTPRGGGVKTYVDRKLRAVAGLGHELTVIAPGEADSFEQVAESGYLQTIAGPVFPLDPRYRFFASEARLHAALDRLAPDLVECGTPWISADMVANWRGPAPRTLIMHLDVFATYPYRWLGGILDRQSIDRHFEWFWRRMRRFGRTYDLVICANHELGRRTAEGGVANVAVEPMGVEPGCFSPERRDRAFRAQVLADCGLGPDATLLLGVGRHSPEKRWPMIVQAVTAVGYRHQVGLVIIGEGRDTARIERAIAGNPHIKLLSPTRDRAAIARLMASSDLLVHGSESESFGMVGAEARASGLPVLVPNRGGTVDQASDGAGWTYRSGDGNALADALRDLLDHQRLAQARIRARRTAPAIRTMDQHFRDMFARYERLVRARRAA